MLGLVRGWISLLRQERLERGPGLRDREGRVLAQEPHGLGVGADVERRHVGEVPQVLRERRDPGELDLLPFVLLQLSMFSNL